MFKKFFHVKTLICIGTIAALLWGVASPVMAATRMVDCTKGKDLQAEIDKAASGDTIEINGVCETNIVIRDKALTLVGQAGDGSDGITGVAANTDGVRIESSRGTVIQGLTVTNPEFTCVRIRFQSEVELTDVEVKDCLNGGATGIWVQEGSRLFGTRLNLHDNLRGLGATNNSRAFCFDCDLNDNDNWAASSHNYSLVSLLDSVANGDRGILANVYSYIDIDCNTHQADPPHACSLDASVLAGVANLESTVAFYDAGDFNGSFWAFDRSEVQLLGARQQSNPSGNIIDEGSSLRVRQFSGNSRVEGHTEVSGFSHALFLDGSTVLEGTLNCSTAGDASADGIDLGTPGYTITNCDHAPPSP